MFWGRFRWSDGGRYPKGIDAYRWFFPLCACSSGGLSLAREWMLTTYKLCLFSLSVLHLFLEYHKAFNCILIGYIYFYTERLSNGVLTLWNSIIYRFLIVNVAGS